MRIKLVLEEGGVRNDRSKLELVFLLAGRTFVLGGAWIRLEGLYAKFMVL